MRIKGHAIMGIAFGWLVVSGTFVFAYTAFTGEERAKYPWTIPLVFVACVITGIVGSVYIWNVYLEWKSLENQVKTKRNPLDDKDKKYRGDDIDG